MTNSSRTPIATLGLLVTTLGLLLTASPAPAIEFNLGVSVNGEAPVGSGADLGELVIGDVLDVDLFIDNPWFESYLGVGVALLFDPAVYTVTGTTPRTQIEWSRDRFETPVLFCLCAFGPFWLDNRIDPTEQSPGILLLVDAAGDSPAAGTGSFEFTSPPFTETRPHASVQLTVTGLGNGDLTTGFGTGQTLVGPAGEPVPDQAIFDSVTATVVPEPGTALLVGLGLVGLATAARRASPSSRS
mgnify:FL=1